METTFEVKTTGKLQFLLIYTFGIIIGFILLIWYWTYDIRIMKELFTNVLSFFPIFPLLGLLLIVPPFWIIRKRIPRKIIIEPNTKVLFIYYSENNYTSYTSDDIAFHLDMDKWYSGLVLYEIIEHHRAGSVCKEKHCIVAPITSISWNREQLAKIAKSLKEAGFYEHKPRKPKLFWDYLISVK